MHTYRIFKALPIAALLAAAGSANAVSHMSAPSNWRFGPDDTFNGVSMNGVARIMLDYDTNWGNGYNICTGTLLQGGTHVLTAAHCADGVAQMRIDFGVSPGLGGTTTSLATRAVSATYLNPGWTGEFLFGTDLALLELSERVNDIQGFALSTTNDVGQEFLMTGYGTTTTGALASPDWSEWGYGHWGLNNFDVTTQVFLDAADAAGIPVLATWSSADGEEYVVDYDRGGAKYNTLGIVAKMTGKQWTSDNGLYGQGLGAWGKYESLITGGDSGGGDFVWDGNEWLLSGVNSWTWDFCSGRLTQACDYVPGNNGSFGDLMGSTAVYAQTGWIESIISPLVPTVQAQGLSVPEPGTYSLMALGLLGATVARRRARG